MGGNQKTESRVSSRGLLGPQRDVSDSSVALHPGRTAFWAGQGDVQSSVPAGQVTSNKVRGTRRKGFGVAVPTLPGAASVPQSTGSEGQQPGLLSLALSCAAGTTPSLFLAGAGPAPEFSPVQLWGGLTVVPCASRSCWVMQSSEAAPQPEPDESAGWRCSGGEAHPDSVALTLLKHR